MRIVCCDLNRIRVTHFFWNSSSHVDMLYHFLKMMMTNQIVWLHSQILVSASCAAKEWSRVQNRVMRFKRITPSWVLKRRILFPQCPSTNYIQTASKEIGCSAWCVLELFCRFPVVQVGPALSEYGEFFKIQFQSSCLIWNSAHWNILLCFTCADWAGQPLAEFPVPSQWDKWRRREWFHSSGNSWRACVYWNEQIFHCLSQSSFRSRQRIMRQITTQCIDSGKITPHVIFTNGSLVMTFPGKDAQELICVNQWIGDLPFCICRV